MRRRPVPLQSAVSSLTRRGGRTGEDIVDMCVHVCAQTHAHTNVFSD